MGDTVFAIEQGSYSDYRVVGIYTTREGAQKVCDWLNSADSMYDKPSIAEWPLNPALDELNAGLSQFSVTMLRDGTTERVSKIEPSSYYIADEWHIWRRTQAPAYRGKGVPDALTGTAWAADESGAIKVANERRTQMIADGKWK